MSTYLEPCRVEEKSERGTVRLVVAVQVVIQEVVELFARDDVRARVDHRASGQLFVEIRVVTSVELVHDHFPHGVRSGRTVLAVSVASVRHAEVERVRPQWRVRQRCCDGRVVQECLQV